MNNKGFAITGILYSVLVLFIVLTALLLFSLQNKKVILDRLKADTVDSLNGEINEVKNVELTASQLGITIQGSNVDNVKDALDYLFDRIG